MPPCCCACSYPWRGFPGRRPPGGRRAGHDRSGRPLPAGAGLLVPPGHPPLFTGSRLRIWSASVRPTEAMPCSFPGSFCSPCFWWPCPPAGAFTPETAAAAPTSPHFLFNALLSLSLRDAGGRLFSLGLLLYLMCDMLVAVSQFPSLFPPPLFRGPGRDVALLPPRAGAHRPVRSGHPFGRCP